MNRFSIILLTILFMLPLSSDAQHKRALVIGLGKYEDTSWARINGDKDVIIVNSLLRTVGFTDIRYLVNERATKKNIVNAFNRLANNSRKGDIVYIHFSGHGQQITDIDGDEQDNWDECWIPYDAYMKCCSKDNGSKHLTDDEINVLLYRIKNKIGSNGKLLVVVDACHSGDSSRGVSSETYRGASDKFHTTINFNPTNKLSEKEDWIILSACKDYQRNAELKTDKGQYGKLTYALCKLLPENKDKSNKHIYNALCNFFDRNRGKLQQTPVMHGVTSEFNIEDIF